MSGVLRKLPGMPTPVWDIAGGGSLGYTRALGRAANAILTLGQDNFAETNGTSLVGKSPLIGGPWSLSSGGWDPSTWIADGSGHVLGTSTLTTKGSVLLSETGASDVTVSIRIVWQTGTPNQGLVVRSGPGGNGYQVVCQSGFLFLQRLDATVPTFLLFDSPTLGTSNVLSVQCAGTSIITYIDGVIRPALTYNTANVYTTNTQHGLFALKSTNSTFSNWLVTAP